MVTVSEEVFNVTSGNKKKGKLGKLGKQYNKMKRVLRIYDMSIWHVVLD